MALIYDASIEPGKVDVATRWAGEQRWFAGDDADQPVEKIAAYRFDDPDGVAGFELLLLQRGETLFQVPVAYRPEPIDDAWAEPIATMEHSVLGTRYVYPATADPVFWRQLVHAVATGTGQVEQHDPDRNRLEETVEVVVIPPRGRLPEQPELVAPYAEGSAAVVRTDEIEARVWHRPEPLSGSPAGALVGRIDDGPELLLAQADVVD